MLYILLSNVSMWDQSEHIRESSYNKKTTKEMLWKQSAPLYMSAQE